MRQGGRRPKVPASLANIDLDRVRRVLFKADGNVTRAAKSLKVSSSDLRRLTLRHPTLIMDALEHAHRLVDKAEEKLLEALDGDHPERSLRAATFILSHSAAAREQGWGGSFGGYGDDPLPPCAPQIVVWEGDMPSGYSPPPPAVPEARRGIEARDGRFLGLGLPRARLRQGGWAGGDFGDLGGRPGPRVSRAAARSSRALE
jgi:hypothetical protein